MVHLSLQEALYMYCHWLGVTQCKCRLLVCLSVHTQPTDPVYTWAWVTTFLPKGSPAFSALQRMLATVEPLLKNQIFLVK